MTQSGDCGVVGLPRQGQAETLQDLLALPGELGDLVQRVIAASARDRLSRLRAMPKRVKAGRRLALLVVEDLEVIGELEQRHVELGQLVGASLATIKRITAELRGEHLLDWRQTKRDDNGRGPNAYQLPLAFDLTPKLKLSRWPLKMSEQQKETERSAAADQSSFSFESAETELETPDEIREVLETAAAEEERLEGVESDAARLARKHGFGPDLDEARTRWGKTQQNELAAVLVGIEAVRAPAAVRPALLRLFARDPAQISNPGGYLVTLIRLELAGRLSSAPPGPGLRKAQPRPPPAAKIEPRAIQGAGLHRFEGWLQEKGYA